jgi:hypothetical protein
VVFEYDGRTDNAKGVTLREADHVANQMPPHTIACTNHYRVRGAPQLCDRYQTLVDHLGRQVEAPEKSEARGKIDAEVAFEIIKATAVRGTIHTVIALPNAKALDVRFATEEANATESPAKRFELATLLSK